MSKPVFETKTTTTMEPVVKTEKTTTLKVGDFVQTQHCGINLISQVEDRRVAAVSVGDRSNRFMNPIRVANIGELTAEEAEQIIGSNGARILDATEVPAAIAKALGVKNAPAPLENFAATVVTPERKQVGILFYQPRNSPSKWDGPLLNPRFRLGDVVVVVRGDSIEVGNMNRFSYVLDQGYYTEQSAEAYPYHVHKGDVLTIRKNNSSENSYTVEGPDYFFIVRPTGISFRAYQGRFVGQVLGTLTV